MRATRLVVDELLKQGKVDEAEAFMEARRLTFVENGYPLRVLNQAYFAFHGSYATGASSTDPIGPKLRQLRAQSATLTRLPHHRRQHHKRCGAGCSVGADERDRHTIPVSVRSDELRHVI